MPWIKNNLQFLFDYKDCNNIRVANSFMSSELYLYLLFCFDLKSNCRSNIE
jgi:hypothetical protein